MERNELKPCPFCGGEANFIGETATIKCKKCGGAFIVTNPLISRLEASEAWNRRADNGTI
jgi:tRNA(Ile2) C34 agmatinyltransferase TiaS